MRRVALLGLLVLLPSCSNVGFPDFLGDIHTVRRNVNAPVGDSENLRRVRGLPTDLPPLATEPGNVWPGAIEPEPTLEQLERQPGASQAPEGAVPGSPEFHPQGSSTPPGNNAPGLPAPNTPPGANAPPSAPLPPVNGRVLQTPKGPAVPTGNGTQNFQQYQGPSGGNSGGILIPNGNGTSTLVHPDGTVETVPTPGK